MDTAARLLSLLDNVSHQKRECRHCGAHLYLVRTNSAVTVAYTREGRDHLSDCPRYSQPPPGSQERLFGETAAEGFEPKR